MSANPLNRLPPNPNPPDSAAGFVVAARAFRAASSDSSVDSSSSADAASASGGAAGGAAGGGGAASDATEPESPISRLVSRIPFAMPKDRRRITVFCGASTPSGARGEAILAATRALGRELARRNIDLVYGGGNIGASAASRSASFLDPTPAGE